MLVLSVAVLVIVIVDAQRIDYEHEHESIETDNNLALMEFTGNLNAEPVNGYRFPNPLLIDKYHYFDNIFCNFSKSPGNLPIVANMLLRRARRTAERRHPAI